jgi:hypothetical protein
MDCSSLVVPVVQEVWIVLCVSSFVGCGGLCGYGVCNGGTRSGWLAVLSGLVTALVREEAVEGLIVVMYGVRLVSDQLFVCEAFFCVSFGLHLSFDCLKGDLVLLQW